MSWRPRRTRTQKQSSVAANGILPRRRFVLGFAAWCDLIGFWTGRVGFFLHAKLQAAPILARISSKIIRTKPILSVRGLAPSTACVASIDARGVPTFSNTGATQESLCTYAAYSSSAVTISGCVGISRSFTGESCRISGRSR